ncbi:unnamed protein product [Bathycoccus prasinos]
MIEINRKGLLVLVFTVIATLEKALAVTNINDSNFHSAIGTCLGTNPVDGTCSSSEYGSMPDWDVSLVTDMSGWNSGYQGFGGRSTFNGDIGSWNTEKVTNMYAIFYQASSFNRDIAGWDTSQVTTVQEMFHSANSFNQDIGGWDTLEVTNMYRMFYLATDFDKSVSGWTGTAATSYQSGMFYGATAFQNAFSCLSSWYYYDYSSYNRGPAYSI